jgi:hypothetical protein
MRWVVRSGVMFPSTSVLQKSKLTTFNIIGAPRTPFEESIIPTLAPFEAMLASVPAVEAMLAPRTAVEATL